MKILFVGCMYPNDSIDYYKDRMKYPAIQSAANVFQWSVIKGLFDNGIDFEVVSFPALPCCPIGYKSMYAKSSKIIYDGKVLGVALRYNTIVAYKQISIRCRLKKFMANWAEKNYTVSDDELVILTYSTYSPFMLAMRNVKKRYPHIKTSVIVTDLVDDATASVFKLSFPKYIQARLEQSIVHRTYESLDKFILLSEYMLEKIPQAIGKYIVIEGMIDGIDNKPVENKDPSCKMVLYTGAISRFTGILDLVEAFKQTGDLSYRLVIMGYGDCVDELKDRILDDDRICYMGNVNRTVAIDYQRKAWLLVNPRKPSISLTRYSFPSKTMEYLSSGTPMLGYHLDGIPEEYYKYFYTPSDQDVNSLAFMIDFILKKPESELKAFAEDAFLFVYRGKTSKAQCQRIITFLSS